MKLPHWASLLVAFAVIAIAWVLQQNASGNIVLPVVAKRRSLDERQGRPRVRRRRAGVERR